MPDKIQGFQGEHRWLSNFWPCPVRLFGMVFPSAEHAYVAEKTLDDDARGLVAAASSAAQAKRIGRRKKFPLRPDFDEVRLLCMKTVVHAKFRQNADLARCLADTGDALLEETNTWGDTYWGVCGGVGENHLGKILMELRDTMVGENRAKARLARG